MNEKIQQIVRHIIALIVSGDFLAIVELTRGIRISSEEISRTLSDYGRTIVMPPENAFEQLNVVEVKGACPRQFSVYMPLWTQQEGRSDLTMELTVKASENGMEVELDDIHVL
ncbi:MAG: hypothetical protein QM796_05275 [Chthoniobacteraceae bacterium]